MMKNNNAFYSCPYCKEEYTEPGDLARCILNCEENKRIEEEKAKKAKLEAEKQKRYDAVIDAYKKFEQLKAEYINDYKYLPFETKGKKYDSHSWFWNSIGLF